VQMLGSPSLTRTCTHTNPKYSASSGFFAGTMGACAGRSRHDVPPCRQNPAAAAPGYALFVRACYL
jgi:hypothetical protein